MMMTSALTMSEASAVPLPVRFNILGQMQFQHQHRGINSQDEHHRSLSNKKVSHKKGSERHRGRAEALDEEGPQSPLDFSKKKLRKEEPVAVEDEDIDVEEDDGDSKSKLRHILKMKSPSVLGDAVLNLSKDSPSPSRWSSGSSGRASVESPSPSMENSNSNSTFRETSPPPGAAAIAQGHGHGHGQYGANVTMGSMGYPLTFPPWGNFASGLSPVAGLPHMGGAALSPVAQAMQQQLNVSMGVVSPSGENVGHHPPQQHQQAGKVRMTRPFKAYPKDPMSFSSVGMYGLPTMGTAANGNEAVLHQQSHQAYAEFRKQMLSSVQVGRGRRGKSGSSGSDDGQMNGLSFSGFSPEAPAPAPQESILDHSPNSKSSGRKTEQQLKDEAYWERRRKNNEAAKRSRDARRAKEDEIAIRAAFLEQENLKLRFELCALKSETAKLRCMLAPQNKLMEQY